MKRLKTALLKVLPPLLLTVALAACGGEEAGKTEVSEEKKAVVVDVEEVSPTRIDDRLELPGKIEAFREVTVSAEVGGVIDRLLVDEGMAVEKGRKLAVIDRENLEIKERQAVLALEQSRIRKEQAAIAVNQAEAAIESATAMERQAEAALAQSVELQRKAVAVKKEAASDRERGVALFEEQLTPRSRLDELEMAYEAASADLASAEEGVKAAAAGLDVARAGKKSSHTGLEAARENLEAARSLEKTAEAVVEEARLALRKSVINSPIDGFVDVVHLEEGEFVKAQDPLLKVVQTKPAKAVFHLPERDVPYLEAGMGALVTVSALDNGDLAGKVSLVGVSSDPVTSTYRLEVDLDNDDGSLRPGMLARLKVLRRSVEDALSVPVFAVVSEQEGTVLYVFREGAAHRRSVVTGVLEGERIQISSGLQAGDLVIVKGQRDLEDGQEVALP